MRFSFRPSNYKSKTPLNLADIKSHAAILDMDWVNENYDRIRNEWKDKIK
ncbi:hypothetical protein [Sporosarcina thermotolerans]